MRRFKKILKWTSMILLLLVSAVTLTIMSRQHLTYTAPYPNIRASTDTAVIARGRHIVYGPAHCIDCHHVGKSDSLLALGQEIPLSGGAEFDLPVGKIYSKNITPDLQTGIGKLSDGEIIRALRYGVHPDGTAVFDFMPFHNTSDEDMTAILSFLRVQKPVNNPVPANKLNAMGYAVKAFLVKPVGPSVEVPRAVKRDTGAAYGKYLAFDLAECNGCHTRRDMAGRFIGEPFAGGNEVHGFITPNLTPDPSGRIYNWSSEQFIQRFRKGKLIPTSPMPWNSFGRMTDEELTAIYHFLHTLPPAKTGALKTSRPE